MSNIVDTIAGTMVATTGRITGVNDLRGTSAIMAIGTRGATVPATMLVTNATTTRTSVIQAATIVGVKAAEEINFLIAWG